jgi:hypothetical protein
MAQQASDGRRLDDRGKMLSLYRRRRTVEIARGIGFSTACGDDGIAEDASAVLVGSVGGIQAPGSRSGAAAPNVAPTNPWVQWTTLAAVGGKRLENRRITARRWVLLDYPGGL